MPSASPVPKHRHFTPNHAEKPQHAGVGINHGTRGEGCAERGPRWWRRAAGARPGPVQPSPKKSPFIDPGGGTRGPGITKTRGKTRHSLFQKQHQGKELEATERKAAAGPGSSLFTVNGARRGGGPRSQLLLKSPTLASFDLLPGREAERWPQLWAPCEGSDRTRGQKGGEPAGHAAAPRRDGARGLLPAPPGGAFMGAPGSGVSGPWHVTQREGRKAGRKGERKEGREEGRKATHCLEEPGWSRVLPGGRELPWPRRPPLTRSVPRSWRGTCRSGRRGRSPATSPRRSSRCW